MGKVLITGITGYIGSRLARKLCLENEVYGLVRQPLNTTYLSEDLRRRIRLIPYCGTGESIAAALERGVRFGPERIPMPEGFEELAEDWWNGYVTATAAGKSLGISRKTFTRRATEWGISQGLKRCPAANQP